jgi:ATP-binding cassette subfamily C (CFTR/MRP) protein 1
MFPVLPRLLGTALTFTQPFLVNAAIKYIEARDSPQNTGYGLIGAYALVYTGLAVRYILGSVGDVANSLYTRS